VALVPYLLAIVDSATGPARRAFAIGWVAGAVAFAGTVYWTADTMAVFGGLPWVVAVPVAGLLVAYLALYPALVALAIHGHVRRWGSAALVVAPFAWVAGELARGVIFGGFPWVLLGYSQVRVIPVLQVASLVGIYGVSWLVVVVAATITYALVAGWRRAVVPVAAVAIGFGAIVAWGSVRAGRGGLLRQGEPVRVGLIQGNVPQGEKWDPRRAREIFDRYLALTHDAAARGATFIVWPESATPFNLEEDPGGRAAVAELARRTGAFLLIGSDLIERGSPDRYYNAAFLVDPSGATAAVYRKVHLVPFGEYVPARRLLFFASPLVESVGDFSPGSEVVALPIGEHAASTAICYEVVYPALAREAVRAGSQLLTTITNDAWYGWSSAPHQHFEQAVARAVEQGRFLVRAANTGISGIVDPYGRVVARTALFERAALVAEVRFLDGRTVYATIGDSFAWASVLLTMLALAAGRPRRRSSLDQQPGRPDPPLPGPRETGRRHAELSLRPLDPPRS
jgi:apolipoprotein N-acyltransferase